MGEGCDLASNSGGGRRMNLREMIWDAQDGNCAYCGVSLTFAETTLDHVRPRSKGGANSYENLVVTCWSCNNTKGDSDPTEMQRAAVKVICRKVQELMAMNKQRYRK